MEEQERIRVGSVQYWIRPVETFDQFAEQVEGLVQTAVDYGIRLLVFPEYFTVQLLTLNNIQRPIREQVRALAARRDDYLALFSDLSSASGMYIVGGSIPASDDGEDTVYNQSYLFAPSGEYDFQGKLHMTRWEKEEWFVSPRSRLRIFDTELGLIAIAICYDVEFPELARAAARQGCFLLCAPSCTDERQGYLRVRYCAQARAIENQMYVILSSTVGSLPMIPAVSLNYGQATILTPSDFPFARDGILAEGNPNQEMMIIGELNLRTIREARERGTVLPLRDSQTTDEVIATADRVSL